jgi:hypothetical protein
LTIEILFFSDIGHFEMGQNVEKWLGTKIQFNHVAFVHCADRWVEMILHFGSWQRNGKFA